MFFFRAVLGIDGIAWATPIADTLALLVSLIFTIPYLKALITKLETT